MDNLNADVLGLNNHPSVDVVLTRIKGLSPGQRKAVLLNDQAMQNIRSGYSEQALPIMAALLEGQDNLLWANKMAQSSFLVNKATYSTAFSQDMQKKKDEKSIEIIKEQCYLLCFESVLYSAYLAQLCSAGDIYNFLLNTKPTALSDKERQAMRPLWTAFGYVPNQPHYEPNQVETDQALNDQKVSIKATVGQIIFLGPAEDQGFKDMVPWHVGVSVGQGEFVGIPGSGGNDLQARENIATHATANQYRVAVGPTVAGLCQRIKQYAEKKS
jgi:hypothetical protein